MTKTFQVVIKTFQELNNISNIINDGLERVNGDFVSMHEMMLPKVDNTLNGTIIVVAYKTR